MSATSMSRMVLLAFVAACGIPLVFAIQHFRREPPVDTKAALAAPAVAKPASDARDQDPAAAAQAKANAVAAALAGPPIPPDSGDGVPATSKQSVAVAIKPGPADRPVVALMTPGKPTIVLSQPPAPKPKAGAVVVESVDIEPGGKFHASGRAQQPQVAAAVATALPGGGSPSTMVLPKIATTTVSRGDSLW